MIFNRPTNLVVGAFGLMFNVVVVGLSGLGIDIPGSLIAAINSAFAGVIAVIAYQPPTVNPGDKLNVTTPQGTATYVQTIATPPAQSPPPVLADTAPKP